jgi:hypothetical protein
MKLGYGSPAATNAASAVIIVPTVVTDEMRNLRGSGAIFPSVKASAVYQARRARTASSE